MARTPGQVSLSIKRIQHRHHRALNAALAELDLSLVQWDVLRHLDREPDANSHRLAQLTFQTDQSFGTLAVRMIERGLLEREAGPGRALRHRITAEGDRRRIAAQSIVDKLARASFRALSRSDLETLGDLLDRVLATEL